MSLLPPHHSQLQPEAVPSHSPNWSEATSRKRHGSRCGTRTLLRSPSMHLLRGLLEAATRAREGDRIAHANWMIHKPHGVRTETAFRLCCIRFFSAAPGHKRPLWEEVIEARDRAGKAAGTGSWEIKSSASNLRQRAELEVKRGYRPSKSIPSDVLRPARLPPQSWGPSAEILEPIGDISQSNRHTGPELERGRRAQTRPKLGHSWQKGTWTRRAATTHTPIYSVPQQNPSSPQLEAFKCGEILGQDGEACSAHHVVTENVFRNGNRDGNNDKVQSETRIKNSLF